MGYTEASQDPHARAVNARRLPRKADMRNGLTLKLVIPDDANFIILEKVISFWHEKMSLFK